MSCLCVLLSITCVRVYVVSSIVVCMMYICVQLALSIALVVGVCIVNENMCLNAPLFPVMLSHTLFLMYAHPMMPLADVFPLVKVSNIIVDVTLKYLKVMFINGYKI